MRTELKGLNFLVEKQKELSGSGIPSSTYNSYAEHDSISGSSKKSSSMAAAATKTKRKKPLWLWQNLRHRHRRRGDLR